MNFYKIKKHRLEPKEVKGFIDAFETEILPQIEVNEQYYLGNNPYILNVKNTDIDAPNWQLRISYARKMINTVAGYMFKPGNIKYNYSNEKYRTSIEEIFTRNKEIIKSSELGKIVSTQGFGYELFLADDEGNPKWVNADPKQIIPIFTDEIDPQLYCFIRYVAYVTDNEKDIYADVYYTENIEHYRIFKNKIIKETEDTQNIYSNYGPPLNIIKNNLEMISDIAPVIMRDGKAGLVDAYDVMFSDGMNEEDRFAWAYLLMSDGLADQDVNKLKNNRIFEHLDKDGFVKFLTKDIPTEFFKLMIDKIKSEIHHQTHIPDFLDMTIGQQASGVALDRLLYDFEFLCSSKESYFIEGLLNRIRILDSIVNVTDSEFVSQDIEIIMERNKPSDKKTNSEIAKMWKESGLPITDKTLVETFATFVKDADEEIKAYEEQEQQKEEEMINREILLGDIYGQGNDDSGVDEQVPGGNSQQNQGIREEA